MQHKQAVYKNISTLILDLRENGGGSTDASQGLLANLITSKMQLKTEMRVNTLKTFVPICGLGINAHSTHGVLVLVKMKMVRFRLGLG